MQCHKHEYRAFLKGSLLCVSRFRFLWSWIHKKRNPDCLSKMDGDWRNKYSTGCVTRRRKKKHTQHLNVLSIRLEIRAHPLISLYIRNKNGTMFSNAPDLRRKHFYFCRWGVEFIGARVDFCSIKCSFAIKIVLWESVVIRLWSN